MGRQAYTENSTVGGGYTLSHSFVKFCFSHVSVFNPNILFIASLSADVQYSYSVAPVVCPIRIASIDIPSTPHMIVSAVIGGVYRINTLSIVNVHVIVADFYTDVAIGFV